MDVQATMDIDRLTDALHKIQRDFLALNGGVFGLCRSTLEHIKDELNEGVCKIAQSVTANNQNSQGLNEQVTLRAKQLCGRRSIICNQACVKLLELYTQTAFAINYSCPVKEIEGLPATCLVEEAAERLLDEDKRESWLEALSQSSAQYQSVNGAIQNMMRGVENALRDGNRRCYDRLACAKLINRRLSKCEQTDDNLRVVLRLTRLREEIGRIRQTVSLVWGKAKQIRNK